MICQKVEALFLKILHQKNNIRDIVTKMKLDYLATIKDFRIKLKKLQGGNPVEIKFCSFLRRHFNNFARK